MQWYAHWEQSWCVLVNLLRQQRRYDGPLCRNSGVACWWCREPGFSWPLLASQTPAHHTSGQRAWPFLSLIFLVTGDQRPGEIEPHSWHCSHHLQFTSNRDSETCFWVASLKRFSVAFRLSSRWSASFSEGRDDSEVTGNWFRNKRNTGHLLPVLNADHYISDRGFR